MPVPSMQMVKHHRLSQNNVISFRFFMRINNMKLLSNELAIGYFFVTEFNIAWYEKMINNACPESSKKLPACSSKSFRLFNYKQA